MEPRHPGGSSSLRQRRRNPLASSLRVGSCGRLGPRRPRNSLGGRAGGPDPLANPHAESFSDARRTFLSLKKEVTEVEFEGRKGWVLRTDRSRLERAEPVETVQIGRAHV